MEYKISNIVILKSGGPNMMVEKILDQRDKVQCLWLDESGNIKRHKFYTYTLQLVLN